MEGAQFQPCPEAPPSSQTMEDKDKMEDEGEKKARIRAKIIKEIMDTERTYQHHLELVIQYFEGPLHDLNLVPDHVIVTIFSNIRQILSINQELLEHLTDSGVGHAFLRMAPFFKLYSTYANNHERALGAMIVREWEQKKPDFGSWRRSQEEVPEMMGLKLNSLLITPVQRVPRYKLLLEDLLANTESSHEDYSSIEEAGKQIGAVASHINEHIRQHENFNKMLAIQKSLAGPGAPRILTPGRIFIKDGPLKKVAKKGGRSHERMFFLFSDILLYAKPKFVDQVLSGSYVCCCVFPLHHCTVDTVFGHSASSGSLFTVTCKNESLLLYSDQKTVQSWLAVLRKAIQSLQACRQTLRKPSSALQPLRRPGLVQLRKQQKKKDPLETAKRTPDRVSHSPRSLKRALAEANMNCLSPRKQMKKPTPVKNLQKTLSPILSGSDMDESISYQKAPTMSDKKRKQETPETGNRVRQKTMANKIMKRIRHISGKSKDRVVCEKENEGAQPHIISPEPKKQGPDCDIEEILDPEQPKWDIFDTALPDTTVVWRPRLDTDPIDMERPKNILRRKRTASETDATTPPPSRPRSEISENTSRIWRARPDSEISDDFEDSSPYPDDTQPPVCYYDDSPGGGYFSSIKPCLSRSSRRERCGSDGDREQCVIAERDAYSHSSREFLSRYAFDEQGSPTTRIYHKQSESMLMPWRTQWVTPSPPNNRDIGDYRSYAGQSVMTDYTHSESPEQWKSASCFDSPYPDSDSSMPPQLRAIEEDSDSSRGADLEGFNTPTTGARALAGEQPETVTTPQKSLQYDNVKSPWKLLEAAGGVASSVVQSPALLNGEAFNGNACCIQ